MLKMIKGNDIKIVDENSDLVERLKKDGWKAKEVKEIIKDELLDENEKLKDKSKKKI